VRLPAGKGHGRPFLGGDRPPGSPVPERKKKVPGSGLLLKENFGLGSRMTEDAGVGHVWSGPERPRGAERVEKKEETTDPARNTAPKMWGMG